MSNPNIINTIAMGSNQYFFRVRRNIHSLFMFDIFDTSGMRVMAYERGARADSAHRIHLLYIGNRGPET